MVGLEGSALDERMDRHGLSDTGGLSCVGGVSLLAPGTAFSTDFSILQELRTEKLFREYLEYREDSFNWAAEELVASCNSPVDLFLQTVPDERLFQEHFFNFVSLREQYSVVVDDADGSKESLADDGSPRFSTEAEIKLIRRKNHKDSLMKRLHGVRRYYAYCKALLQLDFIKWNSNPEEVLKRIKESTRWSDVLNDYELQRGLEGHMKFLRMHVSKLDKTSTSSSMTEFDKVALEEDINSRMSSELEKHLQFPDELLMREYFNRVKIRNLARECCIQAKKTGVILVEEFLPVRNLEEQMLPKSWPQNFGQQLLPRNLPQMKKRVKQSLDSTRAYLHPQGATRARALKYVVGAVSLACIIMAGQRESK
ncbi:hypothetical protein CFC21_010722 [Triticum aestivum]|uniref:Uncharacterized protein n=3 Tax=Triticum TaxID=4564 RepID=A0A9R0V5B2_TRITD|nr:uncharacterized protein LOC123121154 isoform X2 [Triticum aestivum]KAF6993901.1 hypothetical protein CFC21_010722 [Triticum aestivum]VAH16301.1 unnamed protein product [Triticum turgidum subsp. durum]